MAETWRVEGAKKSRPEGGFLLQAKPAYTTLAIAWQT